MIYLLSSSSGPHQEEYEKGKQINLVKFTPILAIRTILHFYERSLNCHVFLQSTVHLYFVLYKRDKEEKYEEGNRHNSWCTCTAIYPVSIVHLPLKLKSWVDIYNMLQSASWYAFRNDNRLVVLAKKQTSHRTSKKWNISISSFWLPVCVSVPLQDEKFLPEARHSKLCLV